MENLPKLHANLFFKTPEAEFLAAARQLEADLPSLSTAVFYTRLAALVAIAGDAHTVVQLESPQAAALGFVGLPIEFRWFEEGIFVTAGQRAWNGDRLVRIGDLPIEEVLAALRRILPHENDHWFRFRVAGYLRNRGILEGIGAAPAQGPVRFGLRTSAAADIEA